MADRFMRKGTTRFYFVPTIASASLVPTAAEVNAGVRLDQEIAEVAGFSFENQPIRTPDMASAFVSQIAGEDSTEDSSLTMYQRKGTDVLRAALPKGAVGYVVIFYSGTTGATPAAGDKADVWPSTVGSNAKMYTADNEAAKYRVRFNLTDPPGIEKTLT